jgi:hypothetical protein
VASDLSDVVGVVRGTKRGIFEPLLETISHISGVLQERRKCCGFNSFPFTNFSDEFTSTDEMKLFAPCAPCKVRSGFTYSPCALVKGNLTNHAG